MTDKRFTYLNTGGWNKDGFLKVMNGLDEKNKKLQKENEELKQTIHRLKQNVDELLSVNVEEELLEENEQLKQIILFANELIQTQHITQHDYWKFRTLCKENGVDLE